MITKILLNNLGVPWHSQFKFSASVAAAALTAGAQVAAAAGSMIYSGSSSHANRANARLMQEKNLEFQRQYWEDQKAFAREQNEWDRQQAIDAFNRENAYNTPAAQMKRLQEAGLNPSVAMSGKTNNAVGQMDTPSDSGLPSPGNIPYMDALQYGNLGYENTIKGIQAISGALKDISQAAVNNASARSHVKKLGLELDGLMAENKLKDLAQINLALENVKKAVADLPSAKKQLAILDHVEAQAKAGATLTQLQADAQGIQNDQLRQLVPLLLYEQNLKNEYLDLQNQNVAADTEYKQANTQNVNTQTEWLPYNAKTQRMGAQAAMSSAAAANKQADAAIQNAKTAWYLAPHQAQQLDNLSELYAASAGEKRLNYGVQIMDIIGRGAQNDFVKEQTEKIKAETDILIKQGEYVKAQAYMNMFCTFITSVTQSYNNIQQGNSATIRAGAEAFGTLGGKK